jgi:hypothetical protein
VSVDLSTFDLSDLCRAVTAWWQEQVRVQGLVEVEELALAISRELAQTMLTSGLKSMSGRASYLGTGQPCCCGETARFVGYRSRWVKTLCGEVRVERAYYHCHHCGTGNLPWDGAQGLNGRVWSPGAKALVVEVCGRLTYAEGTELLQRVAGLSVEESSEQEIMQEVGARLRAEEASDIEAHFEREEPVVTDDRPERLYVSIDAAKAHTDGAWHDVKVGAVYAARKGATGIDEAAQQRYVAAEEHCEAFGRRLYLRALQSGLGHAGEMVVLGDGAEWIWNQANEQFAGSIEILDYWHACEHIWSVARSLYGEGSPQGQRWAREHCHRLKEKGPSSLLRALRRRQVRSAGQREVLRLERGYFTKNQRRMRYPAFRKRGLMIGSGPVEAGCKVVVGQRLKGAGMRWSGSGADAVLAVRTALLNREYDRIARHASAA